MTSTPHVYDSPLVVGGKPTVRIRRVRRDWGICGVLMYRLTHPKGQRPIAGTQSTYLSEGIARKVAEDRGWRCIG